MGGWHITGRRYNSQIYCGAKSLLQLPAEAKGDQIATSYPEFHFSVFGISNGSSYGLDIGIGYNIPGTSTAKPWGAYCYGGALDAPNNWENGTIFNATLGTVVELEIKF